MNAFSGIDTSTKKSMYYVQNSLETQFINKQGIPNSNSSIISYYTSQELKDIMQRSRSNFFLNKTDNYANLD